MPQKTKKVFDIHRTLPDPHRKLPATAAAPKTPRPKTQLPPWKRLLASFLLAALVLLIFIGTWDALNISRAATKVFGSGNLFVLLTEGSVKSQNNRVNILLVGYSIDDPGHPGADLTDSMILLSMNTRDHTGYMLSIPRDLYLKIPGFGYGKINEAYKDGGMSLLKQIIEQDFQTSVNYYMLVNYSAVRDTVNTLGGITINIASPDPRGLYDPNINWADGGPLKLANGPQKINGQTALNLTRARGDPSPDGRLPYGFPQSDFDRTQHQRQVLAAIKDKLSWRLILNPLQNGKIFQAMGKNVKTDIGLGEARSLFKTFNSIPNSNLQSISMRNINGKNLLTSYTADSGQSALVPAAGLESYLQIQAAIDQLNQ